MQNGVALAIQRQKDRPDIHKPFKRPKGSVGYGEDVFTMVRDLKQNIPSLSHRQLSTLVGIATFQIRKALDNTVPDERWTEEDNPASAATELAALQFHYSDRRYEDAPEAEDEVRGGIPVIFSAPALRDPYRVADQSHTVKRAITLATRPFSVAA